MITYCINTMGGAIARGIPSRDVAVAIAADFLRYDDRHEEKLEDWEDEVSVSEDPDIAPRPAWRQHVTVTQEESEWREGAYYVLLTTPEEARGFAVCEETERCDHCGRLPTPSLGLYP